MQFDPPPLAKTTFVSTSPSASALVSATNAVQAVRKVPSTAASPDDIASLAGKAAPLLPSVSLRDVDALAGVARLQELERMRQANPLDPRLFEYLDPTLGGALSSVQKQMFYENGCGGALSNTFGVSIIVPYIIL